MQSSLRVKIPFVVSDDDVGNLLLGKRNVFQAFDRDVSFNDYD